MRTIDLCAGFGGMALGFFLAGFSHVAMADIDKASIATLEANKKDFWPEAEILNADICSPEFREAILKIKADVVCAGFPCQPFSQAGKKRGKDDVRSNPFGTIDFILRDVRPKALVLENVAGFEKDPLFRETLDKLEAAGYCVWTGLLNAEDYRVPQRRKRMFIIACADGKRFGVIRKTGRISLREALQGADGDEGFSYPEHKRKVFQLVPPGGCWRDLPEPIRTDYMGNSLRSGGGKTGMARRLSWDEVSPTLTTSPMQRQTERIHPDETRPLNIREYARIQTFPDSYVLKGSTAAKYRGIGNAVPVLLAEAVGRALKESMQDVL